MWSSKMIKPWEILTKQINPKVQVMTLLIELVPILPLLEQPKNEEKKIDELSRDDNASDIPAQASIENEEQGEQSLH